MFASDATPTAQTAAIPADTPSRPGSAPRQPNASGTLKELENLVSRDVNTAGEEAKRQIGELRVKTLEKLDELRRAWNNAKQMFSDPFKDRDKASDEAAAGQRR